MNYHVSSPQHSLHHLLSASQNKEKVVNPARITKNGQKVLMVGVVALDLVIAVSDRMDIGDV